MIVTGFGERCNLVREGKMFVKDEAKISSRVGGVKPEARMPMPGGLNKKLQ